MDNVPIDGIYKTRANWFENTTWPSDRNVYIQGGLVRLVDYKPYSETEFIHQVYQYVYFFEVNELGEKVGDLPDNFDIRKRE